MILTLANMGGVMPRVNPDLLPDAGAQTALNVRLHKGGVSALKAPVTVATPTKAGPFRTIYRFGTNQPENQYWFTWPHIVNVARGPIFGDTEEKTYFSQGKSGLPQQTKFDLATQSGTGYPVASYSLKLPGPTMAATLTQVEGAGPEVDETRVYVYTHVMTFGSQAIESEPSPPTIGTATKDMVLRVSGFEAVPTGPYYITRRRIYRSITSSGGTNYYFVGEILSSATEFVDNVAPTAVGEALPSLYWDTPPDDLAGLITLPSGALCGFSGKEVCFSVMGMPHAWPEKYRLTSDYNVVAVAAMAQGVVVLTDGYPYYINSTDPESAQMIRLDEEQPCVSARSAVPFGGGVLYASPDGLVLITQSGTKNLTDALFDRESWQALVPSNIFAAKHDGRYYGFLASGGFVFDGSANFTFHDVTATACYVDPVLDQLYIAVGAAIQKWDAGTVKAHQWKSKRFMVGKPVNYAFAEVRANSYSNLVFRLYADGALKLTKTVASGEPFRLPKGFMAKRWEIEISGTDHWTLAAVATTIEELKNV